MGWGGVADLLPPLVVTNLLGWYYSKRNDEDSLMQACQEAQEYQRGISSRRSAAAFLV